MQYLDIVKSLMRIDTTLYRFDMQKIQNRRFMFNPQTGTLILGYQYSGKLKSSHAEELSAADVKEPFDNFVRGWIGTDSKKYINGIIHFAPNISGENIDMFNKGFDTLEMFRRNGANGKTVIRGFGKVWERPFSDLYKEDNDMALDDKTKKEKTAEATAEPSGSIPVTPIELAAENMRDKVKEITDKLEQGIAAIFDSEKYKEFLTTMSKFHNYSVNNSILIMLQKPDASAVAGYNDWVKNFHRYVKKGEKGIKILAPAPYKKEVDVPVLDNSGNRVVGADGKELTEHKEIKVPAFKVTAVFDVSQTDGEPLPAIAEKLEGNIEGYENFFRILKEISPVPIEFEDIKSSANGYFNPVESRIAVSKNLSEIQTLKTTIHEIAHAKLHALPDKEDTEPKDEFTRREKEVQAESIAYTVCQHFGIDTSDYSFGYVAGWSSGKDVKELKESLKIIRETASDMITKIGEKLKTLEMERANEPDLTSSVGSWYVYHYPSDEYGIDIKPDITFADLAVMIDDGTDIYSAVGIGDSVIRERCFTKLAELLDVPYDTVYDKWINAGKDIPDELNPNITPVVTIPFSESNDIKNGTKMPLYKADEFLEKLDMQVDKNEGYYKTDFQIDYIFHGEPDTYTGRYDLGDRDGGLINHIKSYMEYYRYDEGEQSRIAKLGPDALEEHNAKYDMGLNELIPYFNLHKELSVLEEMAKTTLKDNSISDTDKLYYNAVCTYVSDCRKELNNSENGYNLSIPMPKKEDFIKQAPTAEKTKKAKKPSIRKQLEKNKEKTAEAPKKTPKKKSKDLEV